MVTKVIKAQLVHLEHKVTKEYLEELATKVIKELLVQLATKVPLVHKVRKVKKEKLG